MKDKYWLESDYLPIKQIITTHKTSEHAYRYIYFPKLLNKITNHPDLIYSISWPSETSNKSIRFNLIRNIFKQDQWYTYENIWDVIWIVIWMGSYWYHENTEKHLHLIHLLSEIPNMKFSKRQLKI